MKPWYNTERVSQPGSVILQEFSRRQQAQREAKSAGVSKRRFDAAAVNRLTAGWLTEQASIDRELHGDLDRLRARARDLANNNDYVRKYIQLCVANIVGPSGFLLQCRVEDKPGVSDELANQAIETAWYRWCRQAEVSGRLSFNDLCRAMIKSAARDGEFLVRKVIDQSLPCGMALQLIDVDRLDTTYSGTAPGSGNAVVMGVEVDSFQRPLAYWIFAAHPNGLGGADRQRVRIPANEIIHGYITERPEQSRGFPWLHAVIKSLHDLNEYNKSALIAARKGADTLGFFVSPNGEPPVMDDEAEGEPITVSVPGQYDVLPEGYDFRAYESQYPSATYGEFVKAHLRRIATGLGVSYNTLAEDLEGVNYSSIRSGVLNERDQWMGLQSWFIDSFLAPFFESWLVVALANGAITMPNGSALPMAKAEKFKAHLWQGRRWQWVDPLKDIEAARLAVQSGITSPQMVAAQMGNDVDDVLADIARFENSVGKAGVSAVSYAKSPPEGKPGEGSALP